MAAIRKLLFAQFRSGFSPKRCCLHGYHTFCSNTTNFPSSLSSFLADFAVVERPRRRMPFWNSSLASWTRQLVLSRFLEQRQSAHGSLELRGLLMAPSHGAVFGYFNNGFFNVAVDPSNNKEEPMHASLCLVKWFPIVTYKHRNMTTRLRLPDYDSPIMTPQSRLLNYDYPIIRQFRQNWSVSVPGYPGCDQFVDSGLWRDGSVLMHMQ
ncbi:hypothetical protein JTE90_009690 [Oedothorax gibbosus]|uniref:Uncharacterized protein n=1 Tax=Oedothorax gibbosus TaxID=931172 RepID=A0AAV6V7D2_9ARAC|nr:hypothetical protein JTE90_009690 [Oedothorax gibbosus]